MAVATGADLLPEEYGKNASMVTTSAGLCSFCTLRLMAFSKHLWVSNNVNTQQ